MLLETIAITFLVLILAVAAMAVGVIFSGRRITGSCGGLGAIDGLEQCGVCGRDLKKGAPEGCGKRDAQAKKA